MTNDELWIVERMKKCAAFVTEISNISAHIHDTRYQGESLDKLLKALDEFVRTDAHVLSGMYGGK